LRGSQTSNKRIGWVLSVEEHSPRQSLICMTARRVDLAVAHGVDVFVELKAVGRVEVLGCGSAPRFDPQLAPKHDPAAQPLRCSLRSQLQA
jgi:hypothetical protein